MGNIIHLKDNFYYVDVAKNGSSTLRGIKYYYENNKEFIGTNNELWRMYAKTNDFKEFISTKHNRLIFILRNPIERLISYYLNLKKRNDGFKPPINDFKQMVEYAKYEAYKTKYDVHIQPQIINYLHYENYITDIVMINDLSDFLQKEVNVENVKILNSFNILYNEYQQEFTNNLINEIKEIYKEDILLIDKCKDKIYKKE